jgi:outer membrane receptor protein involved in Fe transport
MASGLRRVPRRLRPATAGALPAGCAGLLLAAALALPPPAAAQSAIELAELPLARLLDMEVTGASRVAGRRSESAASVSVVSRDEIEALGWRTLGEALRSLRGTMLVNDRTYDYAGVRGFYASGDYNTRVLLLIDGNRVNDRLYDQAYLGGEFPLEIGEIERIEFVPGQGSAVYGANALFGVINVITRAPGARGGSAGIGLGRDGERWWRAHWQQPTAEGGWRLAASRLRREGAALAYPSSPGADSSRYVPQQNEGSPASAGGASAVPGLEAETREQLRARWDHAGTSFSAIHSDRRQGVPWGLGLVFGDARNTYRDSFTLLSLQHEAMATASEQLTWQLHAGQYRFIGDYVADYPPVTLNRDIGRGRWWGGELRLTSTRFEGHRLVAGLEWERSAELTQRNFDVEPGTDRYLDDERRAQRGALFAEDQIRFGAEWTLHLGGRVDQVRGEGGASSPRVALAWRPADDWHVKAIHGRAFRRANAYEAYYAVDAPGGYRLNPALGPERVRGDELGVEWLPHAQWRVSGSLYRSRARGLLILGYDEPADRYEVANSGAFVAHGAELEIERAGPRLRWRLNAALNHDHSGADAGFPALYPRRQLKGTLVLPLGADWRLGAELQAMSRRGSAPGHALVHLALGGPLPLGAQRPVLQLVLRNAFDRAAADPGPDAQRLPVLPQPGRHWRLQLDWPL